MGKPEGAILFLAEDDGVKPAFAAAWARALRPAFRIDAAVGTPVGPPPEALAALAEQELAWPGPLLAIPDIDQAAYDLVVRFAPNDVARRPALPGEPCLLSWSVGEELAISRFDLAWYRKLSARLAVLVRDLFAQSYYASLMEARRNAEVVLDNLHEGIIVHDLKRRIFFFNRAAERITGLARPEVIGRDCHEVFPERFCRSRCSFCTGEAVPALPSQPYPVVLRTRDERSRQVEVSVTPLTDLVGQLVSEQIHDDSLLAARGEAQRAKDA